MKTKIINLKHLAFASMLFILSFLSLYAFAVNSKTYLGLTDEDEIISLEEDGPYALTIHRSICTNCQYCLGIAPDHLESRIDGKIGKKAGVTSISRSLAEELESACPNDVFEIEYE